MTVTEQARMISKSRVADYAVTAFGQLAYVTAVYILPFAAIIGLLWLAVTLKI